MKFDKPLVCFDLEATGPDPAQDRIVQIGFFKVYLDGMRQEECYLVNPGRPIPPRATEIHKITDEGVKKAPTFKEHAPYLFQALQGCDLVGFNLQK